MDDIKRAVSARIASLVLDTNWNNIVSPIDDRLNQATRVSDLETMVRINGVNGPRYFVVRVKEQY